MPGRWRAARTDIAAAALVASIAMAGCVDDGGSGRDAKVDATGVPPFPTAVVPVDAPVLVAGAGHRMSEFHAVRDPADPLHLVVSAMDYDDPSGSLGCGVFVSRDGGRSWARAAPIPGLDRPHLRFDPWAAFAPDGAVHLICIDSDTVVPGETTLLHTRSDDGGLGWSPAVPVPTRREGMSLDKDSLVATRAGTLIAALRDYNRASDPVSDDLPSGIVLSRSSDGGATWATPTLLEEGTTLPTGFLEGPDGTLYLAHLGNGRMLRVGASGDDGLSWRFADVTEFRIAPAYNDRTRFVDPRPWTALPSMAVDGATGAVYTGVQSWDDAASRFRVHVHRSVDAGRTFVETTAPAFPSQACAACHATHPTVAVDDAGRLGLLVQLAADGAFDKEVWFAASADAGDTWLDPVLLSATDVARSWASPQAWVPEPGSARAIATYVAREPADAPTVASSVATSVAVADLQFRWDGEYWTMLAGPEGFIALWIDHSSDGVPALWSQRVALRAGAAGSGTS